MYLKPMKFRKDLFFPMLQASFYWIFAYPMFQKFYFISLFLGGSCQYHKLAFITKTQMQNKLTRIVVKILKTTFNFLAFFSLQKLKQERFGNSQQVI